MAQQDHSLSREQLIGGVAIVLGVIIILLFISQNTSPHHITQKEQNKADISANTDKYARLYKARAEYLKSVLNLYYVVEGNYPIDINFMVQTIKDSSKDFPTIKKSELKDIKDTAKLPHFKYQVRGDEQAYKFSYTNVEGKKVEVKGNYQKDYQ